MNKKILTLGIIALLILGIVFISGCAKQDILTKLKGVDVSKEDAQLTAYEFIKEKYPSAFILLMDEICSKEKHPACEEKADYKSTGYWKIFVFCENCEKDGSDEFFIVDVEAKTGEAKFITPLKFTPPLKS